MNRDCVISQSQSALTMTQQVSGYQTAPRSTPQTCNCFVREKKPLVQLIVQLDQKERQHTKQPSNSLARLDNTALTKLVSRYYPWEI